MSLPNFGMHDSHPGYSRPGVCYVPLDNVVEMNGDGQPVLGEFGTDLSGTAPRSKELEEDRHSFNAELGAAHLAELASQPDLWTAART